MTRTLLIPLLGSLLLLAGLGPARAGDREHASGSPKLVARPSIAGAPRPGVTLVARTGSWSGAKGYIFEWDVRRSGRWVVLRRGREVTSFRVTRSLLGHRLRLRVTALNDAGRRTATSLPTAVVSATTPLSAPVAGACGTRVGRAPATYEHVVWIWMENKSYKSIVGSPNAPYENSLAKACGVATNYFALGHPSLPNYIAATSGSTQGITDNNPPASHPLLVASIFGQVSSASYQESMPTNCALTDAYPYAVRHNPEAYYVAQRAPCQSHNVPFTVFRANSLPQFAFVTPNLCSDTHDCDVRTGDSWLRAHVPAILASPGYRAGRTAVFITWDEDDNSASNHITLLVLSTGTPVGARSSIAFNHYSLLATTESMLGVDCLGSACGAPSLRGAFGL
jgi:hypothetical protein